MRTRRSLIFWLVRTHTKLIISSVQPLFDPQLLEQFKLNIYAYAELLFRWQLFHKRLELLKAVGRQDGLTSNAEPHRIGESQELLFFGSDLIFSTLPRFAPVMLSKRL